MLKQILIVLFVLIMTVTIGIISLVVFIDPNQFRNIITEKVKDKTGYQLTINGDLRWHVWPQVSILTDSIILSNKGASKPIMTADNMRLDVEIFPLFRKKLSVKNVLIKSTVINITDESLTTADRATDTQTTTINQIQSSQIPSSQIQPTPIESTSIQPTLLEQNQRWSFVLNKFMIANGTVVLQKNHDFITFRNMNLTIDKKDNKTAAIDLSGHINRNQQDLIYQLNAHLDINQYPKNATLEITKLDYDYTGIGVPTGKLVGSLSGTINYKPTPNVVESKNLVFSVNNNIFTGLVKTTLNKKHSTELTLNADKIDVTQLLTYQTSQNDISHIQQTTPVIISNQASTNELDFLNNFDAIFLLNAKEIWINKTVLNNVNLDVKNQDGITKLNNVSFDLNSGHITADGIADGKQNKALVKLNTTMANVDLGLFANNFGIHSDLKGLINATGYLSTDTVIPQNILPALNGKLAISLEQAKLEGINIPDIIQHAVSQYTHHELISSNQFAYTQLTSLLIEANLKNGNMQFSSLNATSNSLDMSGGGNLDMVKGNLDVNLNVKIHDSGNSQNEIMAKLNKVIVPLRIYGDLSKLDYQIKIEQLIKELFTDKLQKKLESLRNRFKN